MLLNRFLLKLKDPLVFVSKNRLNLFATNLSLKKFTSTEAQKDIKSIQDKIENERIQKEIKNALDQSKSKLLAKVTPSILEPYVKLMRLDKLSPVYLVYWPSVWGILGAASYLNTTPDYFMLAMFGLGAIAMRSAGCIVNDMWDRKIDSQVERTKNRPLASGKVSLPGAFVLLGANLSIALSVLLQLNLTTQVLGACCLFPVAIYPAAKRFTDWPQAILGVAFNWGALMGWSAIVCSAASQNLNILSFLPALALYAGCINWTLFYDTIYAFQDIKYDEKLGFKSSALTIRKKPTRWLLGFSTLAASNWALFGLLTSQEPIFYMALGLSMAHFIKQIAVVNYNSPESCAKQFKSNNTIGVILTAGLLASILIK